jgi:hypothetical protein
MRRTRTTDDDEYNNDNEKDDDNDDNYFKIEIEYHFASLIALSISSFSPTSG